MSDKLVKVENEIAIEDFGAQLAEEMQLTVASRPAVQEDIFRCVMCKHGILNHGYLSLTSGDGLIRAPCNAVDCSCIDYVAPRLFRNGASTGLF